MSDVYSGNGGDCFKEAICVEAERIYDSCSDRDCASDLLLTVCSGYSIDSNATIVKSKCAKIADICITVEPVPFNSGFYSVDITYIFDVTLETYERPCGTPTEVRGTASFSKKVILFGSDGGTKTFTSEDTATSSGCDDDGCSVCADILPKATVKAVEPIVLESKLVSPGQSCPQTLCEICEAANSSGETTTTQKCIFVTLGVFSIVQLTRPVSVMIPAYDFCIPTKECTGASSETPCEIFDKIDFPTGEFFPPSMNSDSTQGDGPCPCGC